MSNEILKRLEIWYDDPVKFVKEALGVVPEPWQARTMNGRSRIMIV
jgi:hypothetical protein